VERQGEVVLREPGAELLSAISRLRSITKAAKECGVSYRQAWSIIQAINAAAGAPLVEATAGGAKGGGAHLTRQGEFALELYLQLRTTVRSAAAGILHRLVTAGDEAPPIHLAAAISLQDVIGQLLTDYALHHPTTKVRAVFGASNELADHLLAGAPGDLFISGDATHLDRLQAAGMIEAKQRRKLAVNALAAIASTEKPIKARRPADLAAASIRHVAVAEPASPLGKASHALLHKLDLDEALRPKLLEVDSARAVVAAVQSGAAEVGLAFHSDAVSAGCRLLFQIPASRAGVVYEAAVLRGGQQATAAAQLLAFLSSARAAQCFRRCGFKTQDSKAKTAARLTQ
jgi:molybdate transport system substrate-binding protein